MPTGGKQPERFPEGTRKDKDQELSLLFTQWFELIYVWKGKRKVLTSTPHRFTNGIGDPGRKDKGREFS